MVRNVKLSRGFSVVEIMVSMVILAIVVMIMSHILVATNRSQSKASSDDAGDAIALEYLAKAQNKVINASPSVPYQKDTTIDNESYHIKCEIIPAGSGLPSKATVTVTWTSASGPQSSQIIGYVDLQNVCTDAPINQTANENLPITALNLFELSGTNWIAYTGTEKVVPVSSTAASKIMRVIPSDGNYPAKDRMTYAILNQQDRFVFVGDTIKTARAFTSSDVGTHKLKVQVFDCSGANPTTNNVRELTVRISAESGFPVVPDTTFEAIPEVTDMSTITSATSLGTAPGTAPSGKTIVWSTTSSDCVINSSTGAITLKATSKELLNYEKNNGTITVSVTATLSDDATKKTSATMTFPLKDVPEKPTSPNGIFFNATGVTTLTINTTTAIGTTIAKIFVVDEDRTKPKYAVSLNSPGLNHFKVEEQSDGTWDLKVLDIASVTAPVQFTIDVKDLALSNPDANIVQSDNLLITVTSATSPCTGLSQWHAGGYAQNTAVVYLNRKYNALATISGSLPIATLTPDKIPTYWQDLGGCN